MSDITHPSLRGDLPLLPRYVAGTPALTGAGFKLSSNELAAPVPPSIRAAVEAAMATVNRYPDVHGAALVDKLAGELDLAPRRIVTGGGSIAVLQQLVQAVVDPGRAVVFAWRSYEAYPIVARVCHAVPVAVPLLDHCHDLPEMLDAVRRTDAAMVIVCNPNNPTGTTVDAVQLERFLELVPATCTVVLDEAYREFVDDSFSLDGLAAAAGRENVVVLRTFSKAHGLAGLRVGYGVAPALIADAVRAVALPFTLNGIAEAAALAALDNWSEQALVVKDVIARRDAFAADLTRCGLEVPRSQANFVWLPDSDLSRSLASALSEVGISTREFPGWGHRITIGEPLALAQAVRLARQG